MQKVRKMYGTSAKAFKLGQIFGRLKEKNQKFMKNSG